MNNSVCENQNSSEAIQQECYTYLLQCKDGSIYCGWTVNLEERLKAHNDGVGAKYTRARRPVKLLKSWKFSTRSEAMKFEIYVKSLSRGKKEELLKTEPN